MADGCPTRIEVQFCGTLRRSWGRRIIVVVGVIAWVRWVVVAVAVAAGFCHGEGEAVGFADDAVGDEYGGAGVEVEAAWPVSSVVSVVTARVSLWRVRSLRARTWEPLPSTTMIKPSSASRLTASRAV